MQPLRPDSVLKKDVTATPDVQAQERKTRREILLQHVRRAVRHAGRSQRAPVDAEPQVCYAEKKRKRKGFAENLPALFRNVSRRR